MLKSRYREVSGAAAWALGQISDARAVKPLIAALDDYYMTFRIAAAKALVEINNSGKLGKTEKRHILANREIMIKSHTDSKICQMHEDNKGIGVEFPL